MKILKLTFSTILMAFFAICINAQSITDIKKVDFTNFTHSVGKETVKIKNGLQTGSCKKDADGVQEGTIWNVLKENIAYGDLDGDGKTEAIIPMFANVCGANMLTDETVLVYTLKNGKAAKLPEFEYFDKGCEDEDDCDFNRVMGVSVEYDAKAKAFAVLNYFATPDDGNCCPSFLRKTWFKWDGKKFVESKKGKIEANKPEEL